MRGNMPTRTSLPISRPALSSLPYLHSVMFICKIIIKYYKDIARGCTDHFNNILGDRKMQLRLRILQF